MAKRGKLPKVMDFPGDVKPPGPKKYPDLVTTFVTLPKPIMRGAEPEPLMLCETCGSAVPRPAARLHADWHHKAEIEKRNRDDGQG